MYTRGVVKGCGIVTVAVNDLPPQGRQLQEALKRAGQRPELVAAGLTFLPALSRVEAIVLRQEPVRAPEAKRNDIEAETPER